MAEGSKLRAVLAAVPIVVLVVVVVIVTVFISKNHGETVNVDWVFWQQQTNVAVLIFVSLAAGAVGWWLLRHVVSWMWSKGKKQTGGS